MIEHRQREAKHAAEKERAVSKICGAGMTAVGNVDDLTVVMVASPPGSRLLTSRIVAIGNSPIRC